MRVAVATAMEHLQAETYCSASTNKVKFVEDARKCSTSEARVTTRVFVFLGRLSLHIGYFDEFGHNSLCVSRADRAYKTHPVFGLGGFIIPADNVRQFSGAFRQIKESGLKAEIEAKVTSRGVEAAHWEKKGASLLTTQNVDRYSEVRRIVGGVLKKLDDLGAKVVFYGQQKPRGGPDTIHETNAVRYNHAMRQLIQRIHWDLPDSEKFMMILDKQGDRERLEVFAGAASFMFSHENATRLLEPPMEVESHLYQTVQGADWICGLLGRIAAYKFDPDFDDFSWAPQYFGKRLAQVTSPNSKIRALDGGKDLYPKYLGNLGTCFDPTAVPASRASLNDLRHRFSSR
ncbi:DUF3800 domain-containing protein [Actinomyces sp. F1_1611]